MAFFVEERRGKQTSSDKTVSERFDLELIAIGKRSGFSLAELNEFRVRDLLAYVDLITGADKGKPRQANQEDIDAFYKN